MVYYTDKGAHVGGTEPAYIASRRLLSMAGIKVQLSLYKSLPCDKLKHYLLANITKNTKDIVKG